MWTELGERREVVWPLSHSKSLHVLLPLLQRPFPLSYLLNKRNRRRRRRLRWHLDILILLLPLLSFSALHCVGRKKLVAVEEKRMEEEEDDMEYIMERGRERPLTAGV